jgi:hypothetical protein
VLLVTYAVTYGCSPIFVAAVSAVTGWVVAERNALQLRVSQWPIFSEYIDCARVRRDSLERGLLIPGFYLSLGGADPDKYAQAVAAGTHLPSNHSSAFAPDVDPSLHTAITAEVAMLRDLLKAGGNT